MNSFNYNLVSNSQNYSSPSIRMDSPVRVRRPAGAAAVESAVARRRVFDRSNSQERGYAASSSSSSKRAYENGENSVKRACGEEGSKSGSISKPSDRRLVPFNKRIANAAKCGDTRACERILEEITAEGLKADVYSFNPIVSAFTRIDEARLAHSVFREMIQEELSPDRITYGSLIHLFVKQDKSEEALEVLQEAANRGVKLEILDYTALMKLFLKADNREAFNRVTHEIYKHNVEPDEIALNTLIDLVVSDGFLEEAKKHYRELMLKNTKTQGIEIDLHGFTKRVALVASLDFIERHLGKSNQVVLITGKGLHSKGDLFEMRNYIIAELEKNVPYPCMIDPHNSGRVIVTLPQVLEERPVNRSN